MAFEEDLDEFLDTSTDGLAVGGLVGLSPIAGIYTARNGDVLDVEGYVPTFLCKDSAVDDLSIGHGTLLNLSSLGTFYVRQVQPDGTGMSLLVLEKNA